MRFGAIANSARGGPLRPPPVGDRVKDIKQNWNYQVSWRTHNVWFDPFSDPVSLFECINLHHYCRTKKLTLKGKYSCPSCKW